LLDVVYRYIEMSSESDQVVYANSIEGVDTTNLFQSKKWAVIQDQSSNGGVFSGQIQFNLNTVSNIDQWNNLAEAVITFPIKLSLRKDSTADMITWTPNMMDIGIKNGFYQFIDSVQVTIGGNTIQTAQLYENINCQFKVMTQWDYNTLYKQGISLGVAPDDYNKGSVSADGASTSYTTLSSIAKTVLIPGTKSGIVIDESSNEGYKQRCAYTNCSVESTNCANYILGTNQSLLGHGQYRSTPATTTPDSANLITIYCMGIIRLKDISDAVSKLPLMKQPKGMIYINYNAGEHKITWDATNGSSADLQYITGKSARAIYGHTMPGQMGSAHGVTSSPADTTAHTLTFTAEINGVSDDGITPPQQNARMYIPYFVGTPETDRLLTQKKTIRYLERFNTNFSVKANQSYQGVLNPGLPNVKRINLFPYFTGVNTASAIGDLASCEPNPCLGVLNPCPATTSPFAALTYLQFTVGGVPMFQSPQQYGWEHFLEEIATLGKNGGQDDQSSSGLLDQHQWSELYRYYTCDIGRRLDSSDGASKGVQVALTNATAADMWINADIWFEREIVVDTAMGSITMGV